MASEKFGKERSLAVPAAAWHFSPGNSKSGNKKEIVVRDSGPEGCWNTDSSATAKLVWVRAKWDPIFC